jgi:hypothetical protein
MAHSSLWRNGLVTAEIERNGFARNDVAQAAGLVQGATGAPGPVIHKQLRVAPRSFDAGSFDAARFVR